MAICPFATYRPVKNHSGPRTAKLGVAIHDQEGAGDLFSQFNTPGSATSAHFQILLDGGLNQFLDTDLIAWAQMAGNSAYGAVEVAGFATQPMNAAQMTTLIRLVAWWALEDRFPLAAVDHGGLGITTHCRYQPPKFPADPAWGGHPCPGPIRAAQIPALVAGAKALGAGPAPAPTPAQQPQSSTPLPGDDEVARILSKTITTDAAGNGWWDFDLGGSVVDDDPWSLDAAPGTPPPNPAAGGERYDTGHAGLTIGAAAGFQRVQIVNATPNSGYSIYLKVAP